MKMRLSERSVENESSGDWGFVAECEGRELFIFSVYSCSHSHSATYIFDFGFD